jgi:hypothetical protein
MGLKLSLILGLDISIIGDVWREYAQVHRM